MNMQDALARLRARLNRAALRDTLVRLRARLNRAALRDTLARLRASLNREALLDALDSLRELDVTDLENIGGWPLGARAAVWGLALGLVLAVGYLGHVQGLRADWRDAAAVEQRLRQGFRRKALQVAPLDAQQRQVAALQNTFGTLLAQLPSDAEVPGLLDDITNLGARHNLVFDSIALEPERPRAFYVELPIRIVARGGFHDFGAFASGVASLPRMVTLHDFHIAQDAPEGGALRLELLARTYRYRGTDDDSP